MDYYSNLNIKLLDADIQRSASDFNCGNVFIDNFLKSKEAIIVLNIFVVSFWAFRL